MASSAAMFLYSKDKIRLEKVSGSGSKKSKKEEHVREQLDADIDKLAELQEKLYAEGKHALLIIFQGMDTSGKDSMIKHVMSGINPQGCEVHSFKSPTPEEHRQGYLWRHSLRLPARGKIGIFNRSYYEDVTIARVHHEILKSENLPENHDPQIWQKRFEEINAFEKYLSNNGYLILKFFLHISPEEQRRRLLKRIDDPSKHWKFDVSDIREREHWDAYQKAYEDAFNHTSTDQAPWIIVPSDHKWSARGSVANIIVEAMEGLKSRYPELSPTGKASLKKAKKLLSRE